VPRITDFCICVSVFGCKLSLVRLCDSDFRITPVDGITIGITFAAFCFHIFHSPVLGACFVCQLLFIEIYVFGTAMSVKKVLFVFLFIKVMSGQLKGIVLSISML